MLGYVQLVCNTQYITDCENIKNFLSGLEDGSASTSDRDSSVFVFLASFATELWYLKVIVACTSGIFIVNIITGTLGRMRTVSGSGPQRSGQRRENGGCGCLAPLQW